MIPIQRVESCAKAIVRGAMRGERYVTEPKWFRVTYLWKLLCPEVVEWMMYIASPGEESSEALGKKLMDYSGAKTLLYPESVYAAEPKRD